MHQLADQITETIYQLGGIGADTATTTAEHILTLINHHQEHAA